MFGSRDHRTHYDITKGDSESGKLKAESGKLKRWQWKSESHE
jgi:hypothetical protein